ncbi:hypothetical protein GEMRC1_002297 [Eukaryota sp. GEM-RC1]
MDSPVLSRCELTVEPSFYHRSKPTPLISSDTVTDIEDLDDHMALDDSLDEDLCHTISTKYITISPLSKYNKSLQQYTSLAQANPVWKFTPKQKHLFQECYSKALEVSNSRSKKALNMSIMKRHSYVLTKCQVINRQNKNNASVSVNRNVAYLKWLNILEIVFSRLKQKRVRRLVILACFKFKQKIHLEDRIGPTMAEVRCSSKINMMFYKAQKAKLHYYLGQYCLKKGINFEGTEPPDSLSASSSTTSCESTEKKELNVKVPTVNTFQQSENSPPLECERQPPTHRSLSHRTTVDENRKEILPICDCRMCKLLLEKKQNELEQNTKIHKARTTQMIKQAEADLIRKWKWNSRTITRESKPTAGLLDLLGLSEMDELVFRTVKKDTSCIDKELWLRQSVGHQVKTPRTIDSATVVIQTAIRKKLQRRLLGK